MLQIISEVSKRNDNPFSTLLKELDSIAKFIMQYELVFFIQSIYYMCEFNMKSSLIWEGWQINKGRVGRPKQSPPDLSGVSKVFIILNKFW
jgi:hypothetical protein